MRRLLMAAWLGLGLGCRPPGVDLATPNRALLVDSAAIGGSFFARQKVVVRRVDTTESFEAVLQVHRGRLVLVAMTPMGIKLFTLQQDGTRVETTLQAGLVLPFSPEHVLVDVHRAFFVAMPVASRADGVHRQRVADEVLEETWLAGRLVRREFRADPRASDAAVIVDYGEGLRPGGAWPRRIALEDRRRGYSLEIETLSWDPL